MLSRCRRGAAVPGVLLVVLGCATVPLFGQTEAESISASFRKASKRVLPAVVSVRSHGTPAVGRTPFRRGFPPGVMPNPFVQEFAGVESEGSGIVINAEKGHILTNAHVIPDGVGSVVVLPDGGERAVTQVRRDLKSDLALLVLENPKGLTQAEWGDSDALEIGDWVLAIGHPFGLSGTVSAGIISGKERGAGMSMYEDLLQTDAVVNPGNSGGPLINLKGQVVGIITAIPTRRGGFEGAGFAVPASRARRIATDLAQGGKVRRAYLGVQIGPVDPATAARLNQPGAVAITGVVPDGPAAVAGLRGGDVLVSLQGKPVGGQGALQTAIEVAKVGEPLTLGIDRGGERLEVKVTPKEQAETFGAPGVNPGRFLRGLPRVLPQRELGEPVPVHPTLLPELGLLLNEPVVARAPGVALRDVTGGLLVEGVSADSPAGRSGLEIGMRITDAGGRKVNTIGEFRTAFANRPRKGELVVSVLKGLKPEYVLMLDEPEGDKAQPEAPKAKELAPQ